MEEQEKYVPEPGLPVFSVTEREPTLRVRSEIAALRDALDSLGDCARRLVQAVKLDSCTVAECAAVTHAAAVIRAVQDCESCVETEVDRLIADWPDFGLLRTNTVLLCFKDGTWANVQIVTNAGQLMDPRAIKTLEASGRLGNKSGLAFWVVRCFTEEAAKGSPPGVSEVQALYREQARHGL